MQVVRLIRDFSAAVLDRVLEAVRKPELAP
jgi:hypothetical protein